MCGQLEEAECDAVIIFQCCHSLTAAPLKYTRGTTVLTTASGRTQIAFTKELSYLKSSPSSSNSVVMSPSQLNDSTMAFYPQSRNSNCSPLLNAGPRLRDVTGDHAVEASSRANPDPVPEWRTVRDVHRSYDPAARRAESTPVERLVREFLDAALGRADQLGQCGGSRGIDCVQECHAKEVHGSEACRIKAEVAIRICSLGCQKSGRTIFDARYARIRPACVVAIPQAISFAKDHRAFLLLLQNTQGSECGYQLLDRCALQE